MKKTPASNYALALKDIKDGICSIYVWPMLGWLEIKQRYRRSTLGPFWLTISTGVMIGGMGPLYGALFKQDISTYIAFLAVSFVIWQFISSLVNDSCNAFISAESFIKQIKLPLTVHILKIIWKNLIIFAHNAVIVVLVLLIYRPTLSWHVLLVPLGILMLILNGIWIGLFLGLICARFRDIPQIVSSILQVIFFLTPVMWKAEMLGRHMWLAQINPLFHYLEIVRAPLIGGTANMLSWSVVAALTIIGYAGMLFVFSRFRIRVPYWV